MSLEVTYDAGEMTQAESERVAYHIDLSPLTEHPVSAEVVQVIDEAEDEPLLELGRRAESVSPAPARRQRQNYVYRGRSINRPIYDEDEDKEARDQIVSDYYNVVLEARARRDQVFETYFGEDQEEAVPDTPGEMALNEYYAAIAESQGPGYLFDSDGFTQRLARLEQKWRREGTLEYVRSETNTRNVPDRLLRLLSPKTQENYRLSRQAREKYEATLPGPRHPRE